MSSAEMMLSGARDRGTNGGRGHASDRFSQRNGVLEFAVDND